jgi:serine/threonine protein kinase
VIPGASSSAFPEFLGESAAMRSVHAQIGRALDVPLPVLIEGETGTGKDLVARLIHDRGPTRAGPFVTLSCATMSESLLESVLSGHRCEAVAEADPAACCGTVFLDEVDELSSGAQCQLLRAIGSGEVLSVGAESTVSRIIAATSANLDEGVEAGTFRRDLYYRLRVLTLRLPALRDRREDIPLLAGRLLEVVCRRLAVPPHRLSPEVLAAFAASAWPGNVRQLIHELERAVVASDGLEIRLSDLSPELQAPLNGFARRSTSLALDPASEPGEPASDAAVDQLVRKLAGLAEARGPAQRPGAPSIRGYRLIEKIAEGGMGEVWRAEQREPVRREVALKLIKPGMDMPRSIARFEAERQALALMDHPAIARLLAGGSTDRGHPYFAMEYVRGVALDEYCDQAQLPLRGRIELFRQVCAGVQHAHEKAILHRDLKPANVLVTLIDGEAQAKIIDFGIAKALAQPLTERTLQTGSGQMVGTLGYMSPEQADATQRRIDTRTDVYSLGVMLYQLLSGCLPLASAGLRGSSPKEPRERIRELVPPPPSARFSGATKEATAIARQRRSEPRLVRREIAGDLDAIVMKALEKDRSRRYCSPAELSADLLRFLEQRPVLARTPGTSYRISRFVRRHRKGVAATAGLLLFLLRLGFAVVPQPSRVDRATGNPAESAELRVVAAPAFDQEDWKPRRRSTRYPGTRTAGIEERADSRLRGNRAPRPPATVGRPADTAWK